jgi:hypothetical protein
MPDFNRESSEIALRFHRDADWYIESQIQDVRVYRVYANSERVVELFLRLTTYLDDLVELVIADARDGVAWRASTRFLPTVREALGRLRWPLASFGGAEVSLITEDDQITLTPLLELVIYSRDGRWPERLDLEGIAQREQAPKPLFDPRTVPWSAAPELSQALATVVDRLTMERLP